MSCIMSCDWLLMHARAYLSIRLHPLITDLASITAYINMKDYNKVNLQAKTSWLFQGNGFGHAMNALSFFCVLSENKVTKIRRWCNALGSFCLPTCKLISWWTGMIKRDGRRKCSYLTRKSFRVTKRCSNGRSSHRSLSPFSFGSLRDSTCYLSIPKSKRTQNLN